MDSRISQNELRDLIVVARGERPADVLLRGGRVVNVFSGEIEAGDIAIFRGRVAGIGGGYDADEVVELEGAYVAPGLIDAHVHIESSLCIPAEFARAVVPRGVTAVVADPHEIANVAGAAGVSFMAESARQLRHLLHIVLMAPSCVPATELATAGAHIDATDIAALISGGAVHGLAEVMNFPGVIHADDELLEKFSMPRLLHRPIDGHAPGVGGRDLCAYVAAGVGSDHECVALDEAREKLARGMYVLIREATNARNLDALIPLITGKTSRRICLCTDDRSPPDLLRDGGIDHMLRRVIAAGVDPVTAFRLCTLNPSEWFGLHDVGAIAPGRSADMIVFDDLREPRAGMTFVAGQRVAEDGRCIAATPRAAAPPQVLNSLKLPDQPLDFRIPARGGRIRVIGSRRDQLITEQRVLEPSRRDGLAVADPQRDLLKMAVIERHHTSGRMGLGFIQGIGLQRGAIAGTIAHDHHNLIIIGCDDASMTAAAKTIASMGGGLCAVEGERVLAQLPLRIAGLMSDQPIERVREQYEALMRGSAELGSPLHDPFMAMSFMALEVIPQLKLTDRGLVDVDHQRLVDLFV